MHRRTSGESMGGRLYRSANAAGDTGPAVTPEDAAAGELPPPDAPLPVTTPEDEDGAGRTATNSAIMAAGSLVSRLTGFLRTVALGAALGGAAGGVGDAFTTAQFLPGQIYELLLGGILSSVLVPLLVRRRKADPDGGTAFTQTLLTVAVVGLGVATLLAVAAAPLFTAVYASSQPAAYRGVVTALSYLILPIIFFTGLSALLGAVLNVRGHFAAPMWAPILNNLVVIAACGFYIGLFGAVPDLRPEQMTPGRIAVIGGGTLLGMVVQAAGLIPALRKVGFRWRWRWAPRSLGLGEIGRLAGWMLCYVAANQVGVFVVVRLLNSVDREAARAGLMIYNNVFLLIMMAHGIIGVSIMTALMPRMSAAAAEGRFADLRADLSRGVRTTTAVLAPVAVAYGVLAASIPVVLFQHGAFTPADAAATTGVLLVGAFALLPLSISQMFTYAFYSLQGNKTAALINLPVVAVRVGVQLGLSVALTSAVLAAGLLAGNAVSYLVSAIISALVLRRRIGRLGAREIVASMARVFAAAGLAAAAGWLVVAALPGGDRPGTGQALVQLTVGGTVIGLVYLGAALLLRVREIRQVVSMVRGRLRR